MYIPPQEERYSKVANLTLLLCVIIPSLVVAMLYTDFTFMQSMSAFAIPLAYPIVILTGSKATGLIISSGIHLFAYFMLKRSKLTPKRKITIAIVWGMATALLMRFIFAFELYQSYIRQAVEQAN